MAVVYAVVFVGLVCIAIALGYLAWTNHRAVVLEREQLELELEHERRLARQAREDEALMEFAENDARRGRDRDRERD